MTSPVKYAKPLFQLRSNSNQPIQQVECDVNDVLNAMSYQEKEAIISEFEKQTKNLEMNFENAKNSNGLISGAWDMFKNLTNIGSGSNKTKAQINELKNKIEDLKKDSSKLPEIYKSITDENLTVDGLISLLNKEEGSSLSDKPIAGQSLKNYEEGQKMCVDTVSDIVSGIASVGTVALGSAIGVYAAPYTVEASLSLVSAGLGMAAGTGALVKSAIKASDCLGNEKNTT